MAPREKMLEDLGNINAKVEYMTAMIEETIIDSIKAVKEKDQMLARKIIDGDENIDDMEDEINADCFRFLATQAPLAGDLRHCISIMKMIRDLERIGDHCEDIAKFAIKLEHEEYYKEFVDIPRMANMTSNMVSNAIGAFLNRDLRRARKVWKADEEVDELFDFVYNEQIDIAQNNSENTKVAIMLAFVASHLERIADYATNICEETVFSLEGEYNME